MEKDRDENECRKLEDGVETSTWIHKRENSLFTSCTWMITLHTSISTPSTSYAWRVLCHYPAVTSSVPSAVPLFLLSAVPFSCTSSCVSTETQKSTAIFSVICPSHVLKWGIENKIRTKGLDEAYRAIYGTLETIKNFSPCTQKSLIVQSDKYNFGLLK